MKTSFNASVNLSLSNQANSSDAGALLVREALENSQVMNFLADHLTDSRNPDRVVHSLTSQMRTVILQWALGWFDQSDTQVETLRQEFVEDEAQNIIAVVIA